MSFSSGITTQRKSAHLCMHSLSPWSKSIHGELLSSRAHFRFEIDMSKVIKIFITFNPSSLWEAYRGNPESYQEQKTRDKKSSPQESEIRNEG